MLYCDVAIVNCNQNKGKPMAEINSVSQIVALMRTQMAKKPRPASISTNVLKNQSEKKIGKKKAADAPGKIEKLIALRVKTIHPDDPKKGKKAFRIFLESVLLSELGDNLVNDPAFYQMVGDIQNAMESDPQICEVIDRAVADLLGNNTDPTALPSES